MAGKSVFSKILYAVNIIFAVGLALTYVSVYISPAKFWPAGFLGLAYPILALSNLLFICWWIWRRPKYALLSILILAGGINLHLRYFSWHPAKKLNIENKVQGGFRLMTYNVRIFNKNETNARFEGRDEMIDAMRNSQADIICLQEFYTSKKKPLSDHLNRIAKETGLSHYRLQSSLHDLNDSWGLVIFSRFPILDGGGIDFEQGGVLNDAVYTDLKVGGQPIRLYNVHLQSINLTEGDLDFTDAVEENELPASGRKVAGKFRRAFTMRAQQADSLGHHMSDSPYPVILCGDFNDTPVSYAYHCLSRGLNDAFAKAGTGIGRTHAEMPFLRIDYVLTDPVIDVLSYGTIRKPISDHYPVVVDLAFLPPDNTSAETD